MRVYSKLIPRNTRKFISFTILATILSFFTAIIAFNSFDYVQKGEERALGMAILVISSSICGNILVSLGFCSRLDHHDDEFLFPWILCLVAVFIVATSLNYVFSVFFENIIFHKKIIFFLMVLNPVIYFIVELFYQNTEIRNYNKELIK